MAKRAQQGSVVSCPYCEATIPNVAAECPECRFPLTMAAAECGLRAPEDPRPIASAIQSGLLVPRSGAGARRLRFHDSRSHRMRITAWLLGVTAILLLLAAVGALLTASSPEANSDRVANANLLTALIRVKGDQGYRHEVTVTSVTGNLPSSHPTEVSVNQADGSWFAATRSDSGRCWLLAAHLADGVPLGGTLGKDEPCTGDQVRLRLESKLAERRS